jgi:hypothetical protein
MSAVDSENLIVEVVEVWMTGGIYVDTLLDVSPVRSIAEYGGAKIRINGRALREQVPLIVVTENVLTGDFLSNATHTCAWVLAGDRNLSGGDAQELANELQRDFGLSMWSEQFENIKQQIEDKIVRHPEIAAARALITQARQSVATKPRKFHELSTWPRKAANT